PCGRRESDAAYAKLPLRSQPTRPPRPARARAEGGSRRHLGPQAPDAERPGPGVGPVAGLFLRLSRSFGDRACAEQVLAQLSVEGGVVAAQPLERYRRVLFLVVPVVLEDRPQLVVVAGGGALVVPVDRLELLHDRDGRSMAIDRLRPQLLRRLVQR